MTQHDIPSRLRTLVATILEISPDGITGESRLREDLGMDSLASLEMLSTISADLDIHLEMEDALEIATFDDACRFVERHLAEAKPVEGSQNANATQG
jgi:acyl carrier protein